MELGSALDVGLLVAAGSAAIAIAAVLWALRVTDGARGALRQIENPAADERSAIIDGHDHAAAVMGNLELGAERERLVCGGHGVLVETLAGCGLLAVESGPVPGRCTALTARRQSFPCHERKTTRDEGGGDNDVLNQLLLTHAS